MHSAAAGVCNHFKGLLCCPVSVLPHTSQGAVSASRPESKSLLETNVAMAAATGDFLALIFQLAIWMSTLSSVWNTGQTKIAVKKCFGKLWPKYQNFGKIRYSTISYLFLPCVERFCPSFSLKLLNKLRLFCLQNAITANIIHHVCIFFVFPAIFFYHFQQRLHGSVWWIGRKLR